MENSGFYKITLDLKANLFGELSGGIDFESVAKGRIGNHLVDVDDGGVPIVRTTTRYTIPAHHFLPTHHDIVACINRVVSENALAGLPEQHFNNALIEVYNSTYFKMNYHSDQNLDLDDDSFIALFSCYEKPEDLSVSHIRKLKIKDKVSEAEFEFSLTHNSVVLFSLATNTRFQHKIVLDPVSNGKPSVPDNRWLGITFRKSKTYIRFSDGLPYFSNGKLLELANKEQEAEFFKLRGEENKRLDFVYPELAYTLSVADTMVPKNG